MPTKRVAEDANAKPKKREAALSTGKKYMYLERYLYLILFEGYVCCVLDGKSGLYRPPVDGQPPVGFKEWLEESIGSTLYSTLDALTLE